MVRMQLVIDCHRAAILMPFWADLLGYRASPPPTDFATWNDWYRSVGVPDDELDLTGDGADRLCDPAGQGPTIWFQPVPEDKTVKNRLHLDVFVGTAADGTRLPYPQRVARVRARADELIAAGATEIRAEIDPEHDRFSVGLQDPEGNEFCLV